MTHDAGAVPQDVETGFARQVDRIYLDVKINWVLKQPGSEE